MSSHAVYSFCIGYIRRKISQLAKDLDTTNNNLQIILLKIRKEGPRASWKIKANRAKGILYTYINKIKMSWSEIFMHCIWWILL